MSEVRCSVCGVPTPETEPGAFASADDAVDCALATHTGKHVVCASCTSRLSEEIARGRTSIVRPHDAPQGDTLPALVSSSAKDAAILQNGGPPLRDESRLAGAPRDPGVIEFDFARKRQFAGYELLGEISRGSFGVVYKARQAGLDRVVALKVLLDGVHASHEAIERFNREAKSVARLKHPNVVPIYDIGACDGHHYFAMEFIEGYPLSTHILARTLTISDALHIAECVADAIECAHKAGVIHRDIKPSNILIDKNGVPHITDFGLAKQVDLDNKYTMSGTTLGTPAYMPPEQARGQLDKIDARSDVYALGTVLYEMLTGVTPFSGRSLLEVVVAVINEPVPPPRQLNPKIHYDIQTIVLKCLEKEREQRYASAADFRDDLRRFRSGEAIVARPAGILSRIGRFVIRNKLLLSSSTAALIALAVVLAFIADYRKREESIAKERENIKKKVEEMKEKEQVRWIREWDFTGSSGLERGRPNAFVYAPEGRLPASETLFPPESGSFVGDCRAMVEFTLTEEAAAQGFTAGIQSITSIDGIPYVAEVKSGTIKLWGPSDLYFFANSYKWNKDAPLRLEIKLEKEAPVLVAGLYRLIVQRDGTRLKFTISGEPAPPSALAMAFPNPLDPSLPSPAMTSRRTAAWGPLNLEIQDYNLSHWAMKYTQLVLRKPPGGLLVQSGEVKRKFGGPAGLEITALNNFYTGEYTGALLDFKAILAQTGDEFNQALAHYQMGLIKEICLSTGGEMDKVIKHYLDAKQILYRLRAAKSSPMYREQTELLRELRIRLAVCYAKMSDWGNAYDHWHAVDEELTQGWTDSGKVGETLGWELQTVLDLALKDPDKDAALGPALNVFAHCGLDPASSRLSADARAFGMLLSIKSRFIELRELYDAVPTPALYDVFADAAGRALQMQQIDEAYKLLTYLPADKVKAVAEKANAAAPNKPAALALRAVDVVAALTKAKRWQDAEKLVLRYPTPRAFVQFFDEFPVDALDAEAAAPFYAETLPQLLAAMQKDDAARVAFTRAMDRLGRSLVESARYAELIPLHTAMRGTLRYDARLAPFFAEAVDRATAGGDPDSDELALKLLRYATEHVARSNASLRVAAAEMAKRKAANGDDASFKTIIRIKEAYPAAQLAKSARQALADFCTARRYDDAVAYFIQARPKFFNEGPALLPGLIAALENTESGMRKRLLETTESAVRDQLKKLDDDSALRQWQLEFGDLLLSLAKWDDARKNYQALLATLEIDPATAARAALRLTILNQARPTPVADDTLSPALLSPAAPADIQLAAQALSPTSPMRLPDLITKVKALQSPSLSDAEWTLIFALRARLDGDEAIAQQYFKQALEKAQPGRLWTAAIASDLLRPKKTASAERDGAIAAPQIKPEADEPP